MGIGLQSERRTRHVEQRERLLERARAHRLLLLLGLLDAVAVPLVHDGEDDVEEEPVGTHLEAAAPDRREEETRGSSNGECGFGSGRTQRGADPHNQLNLLCEWIEKEGPVKAAPS